MVSRWSTCLVALLAAAAEASEDPPVLRERIIRGDVEAAAPEFEELLIRRAQIHDQLKQIAALDETREALRREFDARLEIGPRITVRVGDQAVARAILVSPEGHLITASQPVEGLSEVDCQIVSADPSGTLYHQTLRASVLTTSWKDGLTLLKIRELHVSEFHLRPLRYWGSASLGDLAWSRGRIGNISAPARAVAIDSAKQEAEPLEALSKRRDGFISVLESSLTMALDEIGSPAFNVDGEFIGLVIARSSAHASLLLPVDRIRAVLEVNGITCP